VNIFRFRDRVGVLDERSQHFLKTVAWLGGYVTPEQAQELGIRNSVTRVHVQLKDLESWGFIKPVSAYPAIYQVTKSVTRLLGADLSARRQHTLETIRTRLLTVNFYLEAIRWRAKFVLDHKQKISKLFKSLLNLPCFRTAAASRIFGNPWSSSVRPEKSSSGTPIASCTGT
jgi:hypothetical protein